jgi:hypothetical protein
MLSRERGRSKLPASSKLQVINKKVSFADRVALLTGAAEDLRTILAIVEAEAKAMALLHLRFAARKPAQKRPAKSAE